MRVAVPALASFAAALAACAPPAAVPATATSSTAEQAIINGHTCDAKEDPTAVAVIVDADINFQGQGGAQDFPITTLICTGTLIAPDVVLTAAHCTDPSLLTLGFGTVTRADYYVSFQPDLSAMAESNQQPPPAIPDDAVPVRELVKNEQFDVNAFNGNVNGPGEFHDVALLFLSANVEDVEPEVVITKDEAKLLAKDAPVTIAGWGQQTITGQFQQPPPGTVGIKECGDTTINELGDAEMQIGGDQSTIRKCHGDSGGPTYLDVGGDHAKTRRVVGITSHAYDQSDCEKGGVDTRVDVWLDWIDGKMKERCQNGSRTFCDVPGVIPPSYYDPPPDDGKSPKPPKTGCAAAEASPFAALALALFALRRRRVTT